MAFGLWALNFRVKLLGFESRPLGSAASLIQAATPRRRSGPPSHQKGGGRFSRASSSSCKPSATDSLTRKEPVGAASTAEARPAVLAVVGVSENWAGTLFGGPYNKDPTI